MSKANEPERTTWKVPECAKAAGCGRAAIYAAVKAGRIPHIRFGRTILIPKRAFLTWIESCGLQAVKH